jgi:hypothetical protein
VPTKTLDLSEFSSLLQKLCAFDDYFKVLNIFIQHIPLPKICFRAFGNRGIWTSLVTANISLDAAFAAEHDKI